MREIQPVEDKKKFLSELVLDRQAHCNDVYLEEYDRALDQIVDGIFEKDVSIDVLGKLLKKLCKMSNDTYKSQISLYRIL